MASTFKEKLLAFLFGRQPAIFDDEGNIDLHLSKKTWDQWEHRYHDDEYDWHHQKAFDQKPIDEHPVHNKQTHPR